MLYVDFAYKNLRSIIYCRWMVIAFKEVNVSNPSANYNIPSSWMKLLLLWITIITLNKFQGIL